ncbi:hypothetical protein DPMN_182831 [Dreissena polymorpha]|uniref:Uncharacterized protein n=2 Tax=Dreissena polymorpha TaxID=45954 RepID=A0A9D4DG44_DREPO|nr:hypothetical protein DPMN_182831 [Dreissena polymorpha]
MKEIVNKIYEYTLKDDITSVKRCIDDDVMAWNTRDENGTTPLMTAATLNRLAILNLLLTSKCDVNVTDVNGNTALHLAVDEGNCDAAKLLIESGRVIVDAANFKGDTPLMRAAYYDYCEAARILISQGQADLNIRNKSGQTALLIALQEGSRMTSDLIIKSGCDVTICDNLGRSPFYMAIHSPCMKSLDCARALVETGYDLSVDKMWIINDEKHNLFYQDDTLYSHIRGILRKPSSDGNNNKPSLITIPTASISSLCDNNYTSEAVLSPNARTSLSPPYSISPTLKEKIMSTDTPNFIPIPFSKIASETRKSPNASTISPLSSRRNLFKESNSVLSWKRPELASSFSSDSDDVGDDALQKNLKLINLPTYLCEYNSCTESLKDKHMPKVNGAWSPGPRPKFVKSASDGVQSAPCSPLLGIKRQMSAQSGKSGSLECMNSRKTSLPSRSVVKFCTEIHVYGAM